MRFSGAPFSRLDDSILSLPFNTGSRVAIACVRLVFECRETRRRLCRVAEVAVRISPDVPRSRIKRVARSLAWDSLSDFYAGHDPVNESLFLDTPISEISDTEAQQLYRELHLVEVEEAFSPLRGRLLRWLSKAETTKLRAKRSQKAA
jgi:hypothetical protein